MVWALYGPTISELLQSALVRVPVTTYLVVSFMNGAPGSSSAVRVDQAGANISYVRRPRSSPWLAPMIPPIGGIMGASQGLLLGRRTYEMFAPAWSTRTAEDDPGAPFMNETTKYVVTGTLTSADWSNSEIVGPYSAQTIRALKERV